MDAVTLVRLTDMIVAATDSPTGPDDASIVDLIRGLEELVCVATAAQARLSVQLDSSVRAARAAAGEPESRQGRGVASQVALARRESPDRGQRHLGLAKVVTRELPHTWHAWRTGKITEYKAVLIARETACLSLADRAAVDEAVAGDPDRLEAMGEREIADTTRAHAEAIDPEAAVNRRRRAEADRHVSLRPAPDTMTRLSALLPVKDGVAVLAALTRTAQTARATGDPRTKGQVMADALVTAVLETTRPTQDTTWADADTQPKPDTTGPKADSQSTPPSSNDSGNDRGSGSGDRNGNSRVPGLPISLGLVMSDQTLFGHADTPAHLDGYGPVPAELARELVAQACTSEEKIWLRRLYTHPETGQLTQLDSRSRLFPPNLARFIDLRDQRCRTPWCDAPIRHHDHALDHHRGGPTDHTNGQGLCQACNHAKQAPGWHAQPHPTHDDTADDTGDGSAGHTITTRTPTGHTYTSRAPVLITIHERQHPPINLDLYLAS